MKVTTAPTAPQYLVADEKTLPLREPPLQATRSMPPSYAKAAMRCNLAVNGDMLATFVRMSSNKDSSPVAFGCLIPPIILKIDLFLCSS